RGEEEAGREGGAGGPGRLARPATGFAHGAAGIAYALLRLHRQRPDPRLVKAAGEAIAYERANFSAADGNWLDVRAPTDAGRSRYRNSWCHGASGIGLARIGAIGIPTLTDGMQDINIALAVVERNQPPPGSAP